MRGQIAERFERLGGETALIPYVMAGHRGTRSTISAVMGLVRGGADIIELGFPFSDPLADGRVIQNAAYRSLRRGMRLERFFKMVRLIRKRTDIPLVMMTYSNVLHRAGYGDALARAASSGIDGVITPDMPVDESGEYLRAASDVDTIFLVSPNTSVSRMRRIASVSSGFLYAVAVYGTTGAQPSRQEHAVDTISRAKRATNLPVGVGFGVSGPLDMRRYASAGADAVIVGSALLKRLEDAPAGMIERRSADFARAMKRGARA